MRLPQNWQEKDLQLAVASCLKNHGYTAQLEVKFHGGYADILTDWNGGTIIEVKNYLDRNTIYQAYGQLCFYSKETNYNLAITGFLVKNPRERNKAEITASMIQNQEPRLKFLFL